MKILKSHKEILAKRAGGMDTGEETASYQEYRKIDHNPCSDPGELLEIETKDGKKENYYCWVFYPEDPAKKEILPEHIQKHIDKAKKHHRDPFHFEKEVQQERYEWFCGGWIQFYDDILRTEELGGYEHKLFFYWGRKDVPGVAIYINDETAKDESYQTNLNYDQSKKELIYTAPPSDPPNVPPPLPPSEA